MLLHRTYSLTQNLIWGTLQFIFSREEFIVEEVRWTEEVSKNAELIKPKLRNLILFQI